MPWFVNMHRLERLHFYSSLSSGSDSSDSIHFVYCILLTYQSSKYLTFNTDWAGEILVERSPVYFIVSLCYSSAPRVIVVNQSSLSLTNGYKSGTYIEIPCCNSKKKGLICKSLWIFPYFCSFVLLYGSPLLCRGNNAVAT